MKKRIIRLICVVLVLIACGAISLFVVMRRLSRPRPAQYDAAYIEANRGKVQVEIPEVFELANIAIAITDYGLNSPHAVRKKGEYYTRVLQHFLPYRDHPLIARIEFPGDNPYSRYYGFRENSARYVFRGDRIEPGGFYPKSWAWWPDLFTENLELVEDFAGESRFRKFYRENLPFYQEQIEGYRQAVPVKKMWVWLEKNFLERYDSYKVIFSPLIGGSHSTQRSEDKGFKETIMFVSGPDGLSEELSANVREGLLSRVVFTEIDHNYVNPTTSDQWFKICGTFYSVSKWNRQSSYRDPIQTFNEYMTWAVFILYAYDTYEAPEFDEIERVTVNNMVDGRKFVLFEEFSDKLLEFYQNRAEGETIPDLYPEILSWAETM